MCPGSVFGLLEPESSFLAHFASVGEKTWSVQKRPELYSVQVESVLGCHCCETAPPEHHRDILGLASVAWNPGSSKNNRKRLCQQDLQEAEK